MFSRLVDSIRGLQIATATLHLDAPSATELTAIAERGNFHPSEDEAIGFWFARFLSVRLSLWEVINEVLDLIDKPLAAITEDDDLRGFIVGYAAICLLIRVDRLLLFEVGKDGVVQRKLNEAFPEYRIPRKQFTSIFSAFVDHKNVLAIRDAMQFVTKNRSRILAFREDAQVGFIVDQFETLEATLNPSARRHLRRAWSYVSHKWRRRGVVTTQNLLAGIMEGVGRTASEIADLKNKSVTDDVRCSIGDFLVPGDVIITRHAKALTNLFIPGFWPHSALYIGDRGHRFAASAELPEQVDRLWRDDICVLEARKDGVRLRTLAETLSVDKFVVLRPNIDAEIVQQAIARALIHHGKMYKFDFDFFSSDRMVCTEVVYRAYDGLAGIRFPLSERAGRKTLSAEDLLDHALETESFIPVAIFGVAGCDEQILTGNRVSSVLRASYRK